MGKRDLSGGAEHDSGDGLGWRGLHEAGPGECRKQALPRLMASGKLHYGNPHREQHHGQPHQPPDPDTVIDWCWLIAGATMRSPKSHHVIAEPALEIAPYLCGHHFCNPVFF